MSPGAGGAIPAETLRAFDAVDAGLVLVDRAGRPRLVNRAARRLCGFAEGQPTLQRLLRTVFPAHADRRAVVAAIRGALTGDNAANRIEAAPAGDHDGLLVSVGAFRAADGSVDGALIAAVEVGELRALNEQLEQYAADLEAMVFERTREVARSEEKYRELFDASPDIYLAIGPSGRVEEANRTALRLMGLRREDVVGHRFLRFLRPRDRRAVWTPLAAFLEQGSVENLEFDLPRRGGQPLRVIASAVAVRDEDGRIAGSRVVLRDITHRALLERQLSQSERLAATGRLAAGVAHEINNPLQAVLVHLSLVESQLGADFPERDSWQRVREGLRRIQQIVADLLDLHRGADEDRVPVDVNQVVREALNLVQTPLRHRRIATNLELGADLPAVIAVGRHVYQVVLNLLLNAMEVMPRGGTVSVRTRGAPGAGEVEIDVADTGPGIPEELLAHIFDPFLTSGGKRGTGLGLFVTYGLVRQHGGRIRVDSTPGRGSTFRVFFPVGRVVPVSERGDEQGLGQQ